MDEWCFNSLSRSAQGVHRGRSHINSHQRYDQVTNGDHAEFELWLSVVEGPSLCMLRNGDHAFLMYLRFPGDSGFVSGGGADIGAHVQYKLSTGQIDEYPQSWCVPVEQCFKALAYFFVNGGATPRMGRLA
jgi:hypothetical protein